MVKKIVLMAAVALLAASCDKLDLAGLLMPASADVESRVKESLALNEESGPRVVSVASDSYRVYACADVHWLDGSRHLAAFVDSLRSDSLAAAGLLIGDLAGRRGAMPAVAAALRRDPAVHPYAQPLAAVVGNHDLYFGQWEDFKECFGSSTYALTVATPQPPRPLPDARQRRRMPRPHADGLAARTAGAPRRIPPCGGVHACQPPAHRPLAVRQRQPAP